MDQEQRGDGSIINDYTIVHTYIDRCILMYSVSKSYLPLPHVLQFNIPYVFNRFEGEILWIFE